MSTHLTIKNENRPNPRTATPENSIAPFWNQYNAKNQNNMSTHLTIKNENRPNPRTTMPEKKGSTAFE